MLGAASYPGENAEENVLPRFLRDDASGGIGLKPPPLPRTAWMVRLTRGVGAMAALLAQSKPAFSKPLLAKPVLAAVALAPVLASGTYLALSMLPPQRPAPIVPRPVEAQRPRNEVAEALKLVAELEARLTYAQNPQVLAEVAAAVQAEATAGGDAAAAAITNEPDPVGLLLIADVPEGATFLDGMATGRSTWAMAADDPNQLVTAMGEGFDTPALVDVELISRSGMALGFVKLQLHKPAAVPLADAGNGDADKADKAEAPDTAQKIADDSQDAEAKSVKRKRHAHRGYKVARSDRAGARQRAPSVDAYQARQAGAAGAASQEQVQASANEDAGKAAEQQPSGPLAKFFAWLKGGSKKTDAAAAEPVPEPDSSDIDIRRGLGMMPRE